MYPEYAQVPWILIGEYYNANYAIWTREHYPDEILGSVAIAGPVLAKSDFPNYFQYWATIAGADCASAIHTANLETEIVFSGYPSESDDLKSLFHCEIEDDTQFFYSIGQIIQFGIANERNLVCDSLEYYDGAPSLVQQYATVISELLAMT